MKKLLFLMLTFLSPFGLMALPVGNPWQASMFTNGLFWDGGCIDCCDRLCGPCVSWCDMLSFRVGYRGDLVFEKHAELHDNEGNIDHFSLKTNAAIMSFNFFHRFDFYATMGATNFFLDTNAATMGGAVGERLRIWSQTDFSWSAGGRATLLRYSRFALGFEGEYFYCRPDIRTVALGGDETVYPGSNVDLKYREWQIALGVSYQLARFIPYGALKWTKIKVDMDDNEQDIGGTLITLLELESLRALGYAMGVTYRVCDTFTLTTEGRFVDELALTLEGQVRF